MKTELLTLTPVEFCLGSADCPFGGYFIRRFRTMAETWDNCRRVDWLLWILGKLEAEGIPEFAQWCADRASARASDYAARASEYASIAARASGWSAAYYASLAADQVTAGESSDQVAEIRRRWGNPFTSATQTEQKP